MKNHISLTLGIALALLTLSQTNNARAIDWHTGKTIIGTVIACVAVKMTYDTWQYYQGTTQSDTCDLAYAETLQAEPIQVATEDTIEEESDYDKAIKMINIGIFLPE